MLLCGWLVGCGGRVSSPRGAGEEELEVLVTSPGQGAQVSGVLAVRGTATGPVRVVEVAVGTEAYAAAVGIDTWTYALDTRSLPDGDLRLMVRATGTDDAQVVVSLDLVVDNAAPETTGTGVVSRDAGVAPLSVHFWPGFLDSEAAGERFRAYDYTWDFGDLGSGVWSTTGKSRNTAKGAVAVHVYETPGSYTAVLTVRDATGVVATESYTITVEDPEIVYGGTKTTCVATNTDFAGCPAGARQVTTANLDEITQYAEGGQRVLLRRGSAWSAGALAWPNNAGAPPHVAAPVTLGADGSGDRPVITVTAGTFLEINDKQDWRIMDLDLRDPTRSYGTMGGAFNMQRILFLRIRTRGFQGSIGWSHWNDSWGYLIDDMSLVECDLADALENVVYVGGERLALLGNRIHDARDSHVTRVWQAYRSVIQHNLIAGSSLDSTTGRHALKLHGPGFSTLEGVNEYGEPEPDTGLLEHYTEYCIVSDNVFGSSGPWPVSIGAQDGLTDTTLSFIVFERNRVASSYGAQSQTPVQVAVHIEAQHSVVRNNVLDGTGSSNDYTGISVGYDPDRASPAPHDIEVYHNTIYHGDNTYGNGRFGIQVIEGTTAINCRNNLVVFPDATVLIALIDDDGFETTLANNQLNGTVSFADPSNSDPLLRDFTLTSGSSSAIGQGITLTSVLEDFAGRPRPSGSAPAIGALEP